jgi:lipopolysaccharide/colanic/teichoic acid biosynthesis glycosyltransferase
MTAFLLSVIREISGRDQQPAARPAAEQPASKPVRTRAGDPILGESLFKDALVRERKRAERFDTPFAVLVVDRSEGGSGASPWVPILRALKSVKRDIDAVGWLEQGAVVGLLLPDATPKSAARVMQQLRREIAKRLGDGALSAMSVRLYGHRFGAGPEDALLPPVDLLIDAFVPQRKHPGRDFAKRALDMAGSLALLALFSPALLAIWAVVKRTSPGPVLHHQVRIGRRGEPFTMYKFRTMYVNAGHGIHHDYMSWFIKSSGRTPRTGGEVFKLTNDPRITPPGRFLRKASLDELPQFWNVLRGDMSLVGPRPPLPFEVEQYQPWHRRRVLEAKPGITGLWQVRGRSRTTFDEMVRMDLEYARTHSLWLDLKILAATPRAMFKGAC